MDNHDNRIDVKIGTSPEDEAAAEQAAGPGGEAAPAPETDWRAEAERCRDQYVRLQAETENMKKRLEREKADFVKYAHESLIRDLLPILDNLERALEHAPQGPGDCSALAEGVRLTVEGFRTVLGKFGVEPIAALGERFDPNYHEAVMQQEHPAVDEHTVLEEVQKGYTLKDRLLRPAMVVVSRKPEGDDNGY